MQTVARELIRAMKLVRLLAVLCCVLPWPTADAGAGALAKVIFGGVKAVVKSGVVQKTVAYGTAGALAGAGDMAGDYIASKVEATNRLEVAKMQQKAFNDLQVAVPAKSSVTITDITDVTENKSSKASETDLRNLLVAILNTTFPTNRPVVLAQSAIIAPEPVSHSISSDSEKIVFLYYVIGVICFGMLFVCCAGCLCVVKIFCSEKLENDLKVKFLNNV